MKPWSGEDIVSALCARTSDPEAHRVILSHGTRAMKLALACNRLTSKYIQSLLYDEGDPDVQCVVVALTDDQTLLGDSIRSTSTRLREAAASNPLVSDTDLEVAASGGSTRANLWPRVPLELRRRFWSPRRAYNFVYQDPEVTAHPSRCSHAARARALALAAPWLSRAANESGFDGHLLPNLAELEKLRGASVRELEDLVLARPNAAARLLLAVTDPFSTPLYTAFQSEQARGVHKWPEPYTLGLAASARGGALANPFSSAAGPGNPTHFVSPACRVNTSWAHSVEDRSLHFALAIAEFPGLLDTLETLAREWQGSAGDLLEASASLSS